MSANRSAAAEVSPATVLLEQLAAARRVGATFESAWPDALGVALRAADDDERGAWAKVLGGMVASWRAAWERRPPRLPERALRAIADDPDRVPLADRECEAA